MLSCQKTNYNPHSETVPKLKQLLPFYYTSVVRYGLCTAFFLFPGLTKHFKKTKFYFDANVTVGIIKKRFAIKSGSKWQNSCYTAV